MGLHTSSIKSGCEKIRTVRIGGRCWDGENMSEALAVIGSINTAIRLKKAVSVSTGCHPSVVHTPAVINGGGCSYSLKFKEHHIPIITRYAANSNINIKGIYIEYFDKGETKYHAVSG